MQSVCVQIGGTERWLSPELIFHRSKSIVALSSLCPSHDMGWDLEEWTAPFPRSQILRFSLRHRLNNSVGFAVGSRCSGVSCNHCCWPLLWDLLQPRLLPSQWKSLAKNEFQQKITNPNLNSVAKQARLFL